MMNRQTGRWIFALFFVAALASVSALVGVLAYLRLWNAEVIFWTNKPIESDAGKIAWILISIAVLLVASLLAVRACRRQSRN